ncbi:hypothetical protein BD289DRAFT_364437 [Coniella lustricola]|uniref:HECT-type E3 ubiquitin transferase n=1 Tax=Coniella lustricola TaxID=2025994 RepID=A0A2T3ADS0_9PEZI|nr:hypothetical protein BD289DRAFT_364437 [Coniella lustricola]
MNTLSQRSSPPSRGPSHNRSISHPFPSVHPTKKQQPPAPPPPPPQLKKKAQDDFDSDSDSEAEMLGLGPGSRSKAPTYPSGSLNTKPLNDKDFASGNCMTCGSLSRWPKGLRVFKCTLCVTINDLVDLRSVIEPPNQPPAARSNGASTEAGRKAGPISLEITKRLIRDCLRSFLGPALGVRRPSIDTRERGSLDQPRVNGTGWRAEMATNTQNGGDCAVMTPTIEISDLEAMGGERGRGSVESPAQMDASQRSNSLSYPETRPTVRLVNPSPLGRDRERKCGDPEGKRLFRPLEDYIINCFAPPLHCINTSFMQRIPRTPSRRPVQPPVRRPSEPRRDSSPQEPVIPELDAKLLLLGDFAENGMWWTGRKEESAPVRTLSHRDDATSIVSSRSPNIDWVDVDAWYYSVINAGESWTQIYDELIAHTPQRTTAAASNMARLEEEIIEAQEHLRKTLLKVTENLLKRPGRPVKTPEDLRFLLIIAANPLLHSSFDTFAGRFMQPRRESATGASGPLRGSGPVSGQHSPIIKRILGLLSNTSGECHNHLVSWFSRLSESRFIQLKDFAGGFLAYRLIRQNEKKFETIVDVTAGLIPQLAAGRTPASLHAALGQPSRGRNKKPAKEPPKKMVYHDDWQTKAAARILGFLFAANNSSHRRPSPALPPSQDDILNSNAKDQVQARGQIVPTSDFYTTLLDDSDLVADFEAWEYKKSKFSFCQYPFLLSIWAKIQILEHDAKRQMHTKARDAFFDSILSRRNVEQHLTLSVRRDCLVEDSLKSVSEVIGAGGEDIKKALRIAFLGEEGVDAGGLKKEWFLLLVREVFNPDHGMFAYDEDSQYCYFDPNSFETSDQYFLVGVVFGLAIYNSIILDVAFPPFAFRKLLTAAPPPAPGLLTQPRPVMSYTLGDLAEFRPRLAKGLRQLLEFDGDVENTFCLDFVIEIEKYGCIERIPLCPGGERRAVTGNNRREYVDLYVKYLLDTAVTRQFEPFKRGFFTVCGGNALSLFRPEEIELLVRGSDEPLDISALRISAEYENWGKLPHPELTEPTLCWFWDSFKNATPRNQRRLLAFITGSDRIPAMGAASLTIKISCLGDDIGRYPTARTCFNALQLWRYPSRDKLERLLWGAVHESEGFGLK